jgi:hypothetical protein
MTQPPSQPFGPGTATPAAHAPDWQGLFTPAEVEAFHQDDRKAAASIIVLMAGIFTLGLFGYIGVCMWVSGS